MHRILEIHNCTIATPLGNKAIQGKAMGSLTFVPNAAVVVVDGVIDYAGPMEGVPTFDGDCERQVIDAQGKVVLPGFIDSHTHLIFGGFRPDEFKMRLEGRSYMEIMNAGGGIQSTVNATRNTPAVVLERRAQWFIDRMSQMGITTVEAKSGYGLDVITEEKMLDVIQALKNKEGQKVGIVATFLGAHAVPKEYKGRTKDYIELMINEMLPRFKEKADFCDIFTEKDVFEIKESRHFMKKASEMGYKLKFHADEIVTLGGAELAAELGAFSADHLLHISDKGIKALAETGTVATCLPLTAFALKEPFAPARKMIDQGCAVALATDLNPGSCFSGSIPLTIALACIYMNMSIEEVITALTLNAAAAIDKASEIGSIEPGKRGDLVMLHFDNINMLPYYVGMNCVEKTIHDGIITADNN